MLTTLHSSALGCAGVLFSNLMDQVQGSLLRVRQWQPGGGSPQLKLVRPSFLPLLRGGSQAGWSTGPGPHASAFYFYLFYVTFVKFFFIIIIPQAALLLSEIGAVPGLSSVALVACRGRC